MSHEPRTDGKRAASPLPGQTSREPSIHIRLAGLITALLATVALIQQLVRVGLAERTLLPLLADVVLVVAGVWLVIRGRWWWSTRALFLAYTTFTVLLATGLLLLAIQESRSRITPQWAYLIGLAVCTTLLLFAWQREKRRQGGCSKLGCQAGASRRPPGAERGGRIGRPM